MQVCRICLENNSKFYSLKEYCFDVYYEHLTGIDVNSDNLLPTVLCWECAHRLKAFWKFKTKARRSNSILLGILKNHQSLSAEFIQSIDRHANMLATTLAHKAFNVNHCDLQIDEESDRFSNCFVEDIEFHTLDLEVKNEEVDQNDKSESFENELHDNEFKDENSNHSSDIVLSKHKDYKIKENTKKLKNKPMKKERKIIKVDKRRKSAKEVLNEDVFLITDLTHEEQLLEIKRRQESCNYKRSEYQCEKCFKGFLDAEAYKCHMSRHTDQSGAFECEICKVRFRTLHALRNHVTSHVQRFSCKRCAYVTTRRHAAKLHEEYHNGTKYQCPHCLEEFVKFSTYMSHVRIKHPSDFVCDRCGYSFVSAKGLGLHKKLKHRAEEELPIPLDGPQCEQCNVRFATEDAMDRHLKLSARHKEYTKSTNIDRKTKEQRGTEENSRKKKETERKRQNKGSCKPEGPIACEQCEMQLPDSVSYYRHFRRMHPDKNRTNYPSMKTKCMCEVCGKMFQSLALLQDHSFTHTDSKQFKCAQCGKTFQRKYRLIAHRKLHASQRSSHSCAVCGKRFTTASNMQRHMVSHTGLKPFKCEMCGKCFKHASEKRVHITYVHLKKPWPKRSRTKRGDTRQLQVVPTPRPPEDIVQPLWAACSNPKFGDANGDKYSQYNMKI